MTPTPNASGATPPLRQSCDRCHKQKLRCTRAGKSNTGACDRCLRKRAQCVYSSSLPKGRPSMYQSSEDSNGLGNSGPPRSVSITAIQDPEVVSADGLNDVDGGMDVDMRPDVKFNPHLGDHSSMPGSVVEDTFLAPSTEPYPWAEWLCWDDTHLDWGEQDAGQQPVFNWQAVMNQAQMEQNITQAAFEASPGPLDHHGVAKMEDDGADHIRRHHSRVSSLLPQDLAHLPGHDHIGPSIANDPIAIIAELAQLSVRLSPLRRTSHHLAEVAERSHQQSQGRSSPLIDDASFEMVAAWLAHVSVNMNIAAPPDGLNARANPIPAMPETSTTGAMLHQVFSASRHLLEILQYLGAYPATGASTPNFPASMSTSSASSEASYFGSSKGRSSSSSSLSSIYQPCTPGQGPAYYSDIISQLLMACNTTLLNVFAAVLDILERGTDPRAHGNSAAALGDIRLFTVVQLCSYLIGRQHQAIDMYLASQSSSYTALPADLMDLFGPMQPDPPVMDTATREAMSGLKSELQERLVRLQQRLHM